MFLHGAIRTLSRGMAGSTVQRGVEYEQLSMTVLQDYFSMSLRRIGGKSDGGIDLQGWWWLPRDEGSLNDHPDTYRRLRVLAQCKREAKNVAPKYIRELEGVLHRYNATQPSTANDPKLPPVVGMLISTSPLTKLASLLAHTSTLPLILLHTPETDGSEASDGGFTEGSVVFNPALGSSSGLLHGHCEARWEHANNPTDVGRLGLWWKGSRMKSWTPDGVDDGLEMKA